MDRLTEMAGACAGLLKERGVSVAVAESSAGGLISASLLSVPGASAYFLGGGVVYTRTARRALLDLPEEVITTNAGSEEYALILARAVRDRFDATWGLCETGATGPTGSRYGHDAGHCCIAVAGPVERSMTLETRNAEREPNMWRFADTALRLLEETLREN